MNIYLHVYVHVFIVYNGKSGIWYTLGLYSTLAAPLARVIHCMHADGMCKTYI